MNKKVLCLVVVLSLILLLAGCSSANKSGGQQTQPTQPNTVSIEGFQFNPSTITINKGDTVAWINQDSAPHTVTGSGVDSGSLGKSASFQHTFRDAGTFDYHCSFHSTMKGQVIIK